jgi:cytochrome c556
VLRQISIIVLFGLSSCSSPAPGPRLPRDPSKTTELGLFMKTHVNPSFSKISFLLFHEEDSDTDIDPAALPASADELAHSAERLSKWPDLPAESEQSKLVFDEYAESLKTDANKLVEALRGKQLDNARKIFESLHRKCDACHHFFRYDQTPVLDTRGTPRP